MTISLRKTLRSLYGRDGIQIEVPESAHVLEGQGVASLDDPNAAVREAINAPIGSAPLSELLRRKQPTKVAISISDITRPVPNEAIVSNLLAILNDSGIADRQVLIIIATGMHRSSTSAERQEMLGDLLERCQVIDHRADDPDELVRVSDTPTVSANRSFAEADFRIVTGLIEPHFMAGFSGGRKGVCPGLVDKATVQRFHSYEPMADSKSATGVLEGNPCHRESLRVARLVGVDFLVNVAIDRQRQPTAFYCGDMEKAHQMGAEQVQRWTTAVVDEPYDLIVTNGGGYPLDQTFYQTVKGMVTPIEAMHDETVVAIASDCGEGIGSTEYADTMRQWGADWRRFIKHIATTEDVVKDQWQYQMHTRVLNRIGVDKLRLITDGLHPNVQHQLAVNPVLGNGDATTRSQRFIDDFVTEHPDARLAVIPDGPYTTVTRRQR